MGSVKADSIPNAMEKLQARISRSITLAHLRVIIVGEELARRKNFNDIQDFFRKSAYIALRLRLGFVQNGEAEDLFPTKPQFENTVSEKYIAMTQMEKELSLMRTNRFFDFLSDLRSTGGTAFGARIIASEEGESVIRHGGAVFDKWRLAGWLSSEETQAANWIVGEANARVVGKTSDGTYTYAVDKKSTRIIPVHKNGQLQFLVKVKTDGNIIEEQGRHLDFSRPQNIEKMEKLFSRTIARQVESAISKSQNKFNVDYLGFGKVLKQYEPETFKNVNWEELFPGIPINVEVKSNISRFGLVK